MLKSRIITATILIISVLAVIFYGNNLLQAGVVLLICLFASHEWLRLIGAKTAQMIVFYVVLIFCCAVFYYIPPFAQAILWISVAGWIAALMVTLAYQYGQAMIAPLHLWRNSLIGLWLIVPMFAGLYLLLSANPVLVLFLLILVWSCDIFAFFAGRRFGRHLLASRVSPGKSWEGAFGAFICTSIIAYACIKFMLPHDNMVALMLVSLCIIPITILGDLFESVVKRIFNVKDSGNLLPGHGGVLDRLDSLTAAAPIFAFAYFTLLGNGA